MRADTIVLTLVGVGIIVTGIVLILQIRQQPVKEEVVRREVDVEIDPVAGSWGWGWAGGWLPSWGYRPYYSRMPIRPLLY
jgi:hypothetical protein